MYAIETMDITKEFRYINPPPGEAQTDMWLDYLISWLTGKRSTSYGVEKKFLTAVDQVNLQIKKGEFFGLLGPNGAGKTTLLKMLATLLIPTSGTAIINGYDLVRQPEAVRGSINVVQSGGWLAFDHGITIRMNLIFWARMYGLSRSEAEKRADEVLSIVELQSKANQGTDALSSGMRQRLTLAKGLLCYCPIFLLDEPTAGLDPNSAQRVRAFIRHELNLAHGQTVLMSTHDMLEAERLCDRVAIINEGRIIACGSLEDLKQMMKSRVYVCECERLDFETLRRIKEIRPIRIVSDQIRNHGGGNLRIHAEKEARGGEDKIKELLTQCGASPISVKAEARTLEDIFMSLTGRKFEDDRSKREN